MKVTVKPKPGEFASEFDGGHRELLARIALVALWFGLFTGMGEIGLLAIKKFLLGHVIRLGLDVFWVAPVTDVVAFMMVGLVLVFVKKFWPKFISLQKVILVFSFLCFISLLLMISQLHGYAALVLAAGLAVQASRSIAKHAGRFGGLMRHSIAMMAAIVVVLAIIVHGWPWVAGRQALATLPPAPRNAPNVLLIVLDTVRAESLTVYGYPKATTPELEKFAKTGVVFERAIATAPWTLPSHASMFTGHYPNRLSADWLSPLDKTHVTLAESLRARGYTTGGFVANTIYGSYEHGLNRGFVHYEDYLLSPGQIILSFSLGRAVTNRAEFRWLIGSADILGRKTAGEINSRFLQWLSETGNRPFFAFLNYFDAHEPYVSPESFAKSFGVQRTRTKAAIINRTNSAEIIDWRKMTPEDVEAENNAYDSAIAYIDHELGELLEELGKRGILENTLVIVTSDHGEQLGEHNLFSHGNSLYRPLLHVPLLIVLPKQAGAGTRVPELVSLRDLPITVIDVLGLENVDSFPGHSLVEYWNPTDGLKGHRQTPILSEVSGGTGGPEYQPIARGNMKSLFFEGMHYIRNGDGSEELYEWGTDPREERNLVTSKNRTGALVNAREHLKSLL